MPSVTYLREPAQVADFIASLQGTRELAVDTEGASFHRFVDRVYLLQLSTRSHHAILDPLAVEPPEALRALVEGEGVEVVFHDADYDLRLLRQDYAWRATNLFDTRIAAQLIGLPQFGLAALLERYFDVRLDKRHQRADWSMRPLTDDMLAYAAQDTMHLLGLRDVLRDALDKLGRLHWAREEFDRIQDVQWEADDPSQAFMRIKGARDLNRRELAVLRELVHWRDRAAASVDRATFRVMANETLLDLARAMPDTVGAITGMRGIPRSGPGSRVDAILEAVERGRAVPEDDLPRFPRGQRWERDAQFDARVTALRTAREGVAKRLALDPGVLCSRERLETIARLRPTDIDALAAIDGVRRWQVEVLGDPLLKAVRSV